MQAIDGTETLVIDCSLTMAWYFKDEGTPYTSAVRASLAGGRAAVPSIWPLEVANVLLIAERRQRSNPTRAARWLRYLSALPIAVDEEASSRAFQPILDLARAHGLTSYDAAYLDLARRLGLPVATLDLALKRAAQAIGVTLFTPPGGPTGA